MSRRRIIGSIVAAIAVVGAGSSPGSPSARARWISPAGTACRWRNIAALSVTGVPADFGSADPVARGKYLTLAADCQACHTAKGGVPFAGGLPFKLPFGTIWSPNITPDKATGIGSWTDAQFLAALREGKGPKGHLYPAMPYSSYTWMTDADGLAIRAYLATLAPARFATAETHLLLPVQPALADVGLEWPVQPEPPFRAEHRPQPRVEPRRLSL